MALDRIKGKIVFLCDGDGVDVCHEDLDTDEREFAAAKEELDEAGWRAFSKGEGRWGHRCPACAQSWIDNRRGDRR